MKNGALATKSKRIQQTNRDPSVESISATMEMYDDEYDDIFRSLDEAIDRTTARLLAMDDTPTKSPKHEDGQVSKIGSVRKEIQGRDSGNSILMAEGMRDQASTKVKQAGLDHEEPPQKESGSDNKKTVEEELARIGRQSDSNKAAIEIILTKLTRQDKLAADALRKNIIKISDEKRKASEEREALSTLKENSLAATKEDLAMLKTMKIVAKNTKVQNSFLKLQLAEATKQGAISRRFAIWTVGTGAVAAATGIILIAISLWGIPANGATQKSGDGQEVSAPASESTSPNKPSPKKPLPSEPLTPPSSQ